MLAQVSSVLGESGVSILTVLQRGEGDSARLVMILHRSPEGQVAEAIGRLAEMPEVTAPPVLIAVVGSGEAPR